MFDTVLIANRGEIAVRIQRACEHLGLKTVMVYSQGDAGAAYLEYADRALCIGPAAPGQSYLDKTAVLCAALASGAQAIHPGYGFLSENGEFSQAVTDAGLTFIGPSADCIRRMGDKVAAKQAMRDAGVPCVPGPLGALPDDKQEVLKIAAEIGYPVIIKAAGGGGGRGMRVVTQHSELTQAVNVTREEARRAFGNPELYMEKFLGQPRHVEIQVLCDQHGNGIWLGSRDCSLQRRHQKVLEEAPAPGIDAGLMERVGVRCVEACIHIGYHGVGTFEFLYEDGEFYFIEMNTRLQVEHPVTEMTTGIDIVEQQLRVALGERLSIQQSDVRSLGHALECRINAECAETFIPNAGTVTRWDLPGGIGVRVDTHVRAGYKIPAYYDSMIAKVITHGATRDQALVRMRTALAQFHVEGVSTNLPLHLQILEDGAFKNGAVDIHHLEAWLKLKQGRS
ncbi:acetyl-CoA carboxylase biotin carboxylase subunit [Pseudomonas shirazica]|nr:acetyl-CoA carboxylase biotin carboxylase subunit [Pseudomonas shirazica]